LPQNPKTPCILLQNKLNKTQIVMFLHEFQFL